jgi:multidrug resistance efflux pump
MTEKSNQPITNEPSVDASTSKTKKDPVTIVTKLVLLLAALIFGWYILSDRFTPYTTQARIKEIVIPITPRVSGNLIKVLVKQHDRVQTGQLMFQIDTIPYALDVKKARANIDQILQQLGAQDATVKAAASAVGMAKAQLDRAQRNYDRTERVMKKNPGALSQANIDRVETALNQAKEQLNNALANLDKAKKQLGPTGENNPQLRMAINELNKAQLQLDWTNIYAPAEGVIESFNTDVGYYCQAGKPIATLLTKEDVWIQADFKENNLSNMEPGDDVEFILDVAPGKIFKGKVRSIGYGVAAGNKVVPGELPKISSRSSWLQDPQRFPVLLTVNDSTALSLARAGGQADVVVFTGHHPFLNFVAKIRIRINSWISYVR